MADPAALPTTPAASAAAQQQLPPPSLAPAATDAAAPAPSTPLQQDVVMHAVEEKPVPDAAQQPSPPPPASLHHLLSPQSQAADPARASPSPTPAHPPAAVLGKSSLVDSTVPPANGEASLASTAEGGVDPCIDPSLAPTPTAPQNLPSKTLAPQSGFAETGRLWIDPATGVAYAPPPGGVEGQAGLEATLDEPPEDPAAEGSKGTGKSEAKKPAAPRKSRASIAPPKPPISSPASTSTPPPPRKKPRASAAAAAKVLAEAQPTTYDSDLEAAPNAALVESTVGAWDVRWSEREANIARWFEEDEKARHQAQIDRTAAALAAKIETISTRITEAEAHRLREAARLKAIADEAARMQAEKDRVAAERKARAAEARQRYKAKVKAKAQEKKDEEERKRKEEEEERRVEREKLKVRLTLNGEDGDADAAAMLEDELSDMDTIASTSKPPRYSVGGLANLPYNASRPSSIAGGGREDDSDFSDFENFGLDDRAGKRRKVDHDEIDELATSEDEGTEQELTMAQRGLEPSGRKSRATGVGKGNWKRPPKNTDDVANKQHQPFSVPPDHPEDAAAYPLSDDYPSAGAYDDAFSALPGHFGNGLNGEGGDALYDLDGGLSSARASPQPTGPLMETEEEFAWRIEEARRKVWSVIVRKDIPRVYQTVVSSVNARRREQKKLAFAMVREGKRPIIRVQKAPKLLQLKAKKMNREMLMFWKRNEKDERENRKRAEREALERAKKEEEERESKRQARKLNFLITQTELYSHFVGSKIKTAEAEESADTGSSGLPSLPNVPAAALAESSADAKLQELDFNEDNEDNLAAHARKNAQDAMLADRAKAAAFDKAAAEERRKNEALAAGESMDMDPDELNFQNPTMMNDKVVEQPKMLTATLKDYQLKGLTWLANLYEQGINGILADEMGLGKTIQSIALMGYLAEVHDIWGPFLVVAPASTLHNWQQEISRFVPQLKALPYWGNVKDRATLRKFWNRKQISYNKDAPFHVLVTSYQLVVTDEKYFQKVKWQYMILDEAQAIKSSSSTRWKTLLGFHCRNRLLLTGTPIQNSMHELWALLHFIMPSLFDSHDEFSEWFSRDIENAADNKGGGKYNEHQLRRLHMILKPFMLRRVKKHVQNELGDKIELDVYVDPSPIQRTMYKSLRANISLAELMDRASNDDEAGVQSLMNIVMQLRKVCNHPQLFDRADVKAPLAFGSFSRTASIMREGEFLTCPDSARNPIEVTVPRIFEEDGGLLDVPGENVRAGSDTYRLQTMMSIWSTDYIAQSLKQKGSAFSALPLLNITAGEAHAHVKRTPLQNLVSSAARNADRLRSAPYEFEPEFTASRTSPHSIQALVRPAGSFLPPPTDDPTLHPLNEAVERAWSRSYLSRSSARFALPRAVAPPISSYSTSVSYMNRQQRVMYDELSTKALFGLSPKDREDPQAVQALQTVLPGLPFDGLVGRTPSEHLPRANMTMPDINRLIFDSAKLARLDSLLRELKAGGHRVLIFFQMTRMIDLLEEYLVHRNYRYLRLDGSSKIEDRRDMVTSWQSDPDLFVFLLSTRAGGLGINLTAADTVIFYDNDWNPSNDAQAMDRVHRLGQTKQVTVYRLITKGTIDERIVKLARQKKDVQDIVVGQKPVGEVVKTNEVLSLLMDDDELAAATARRAQAEKDGLSAPVTAKGKGKGKQAKKAGASVAALSKDADEDDFFGGGGSKNAQQDDDDDEAPADAPAPKRQRKSKAKGPSKRKKHVDMEEI